MRWMLIKGALIASPCVVFLIELALVKFLVRPSRRVLNGFAFFGLLAAGKFTGFTFFGGNDFNPELPVWLIVVWGWMESIVWVGLPIGIVVTLLAWIVKPFRTYAFRTALIASLLFATYGMWEGVRVPPVVEKEIQIAGLPWDFDGYRLVHLSDLHCSSAARRGKIAAIVQRVNGVRPDLVAITGDFVDGFPEDRAADLEPLKDLRAKDGVLACVGNHELYFEIDRWAPYYREWNVRVLRNEWTQIRRGDATLAVGGEDDGLFDMTSCKTLVSNAPPAGCRILLKHRPTGCRYNESEMDVRLQLSGHTHGGAMPLIAGFVARENQGHVRGLYREGKLLLHVSPGTGQWAGFPLRFFNSPEISVLVLRSRF